MSIHDERREMTLGLLRAAGDEPLSPKALRAAGVDHPATVIYELQLSGEPIEYVHHQGSVVGYRLGAGQPPR